MALNGDSGRVMAEGDDEARQPTSTTNDLSNVSSSKLASLQLPHAATAAVATAKQVSFDPLVTHLRGQTPPLLQSSSVPFPSSSSSSSSTSPSSSKVVSETSPASTSKLSKVSGTEISDSHEGTSEGIPRSTLLTSNPSSPPSSPKLPPFKKRRSSLKSGAAMPNLPTKEQYQHPDPLLRRLRLINEFGKPVNLSQEFRDTQLVAFLFGGAYPGASNLPYTIVDKFAMAHPHRLKVIYCSVDPDEEAYLAMSRGKSWLCMQWNDGSNMTMETTASALQSTTSSSSSLFTQDELLSKREPFLMAGEPDLEEDLPTSSDPEGTLYLRPYSRVFLAEKLQVLGIPNLVIYHLDKREILTHHARIESLKKTENAERLYEKWCQGERTDFTLSYFFNGIKYTLALGVVAGSYLIAVRYGGVEDVLGQLSQTLTKTYLGVK